MSQNPCPNCGYCPTCKRANTPMPVWVNPWPTYWPPYQQPYWLWTTTADTSGGMTFRGINQTVPPDLPGVTITMTNNTQPVLS